jgi:hypothetical protein
MDREATRQPELFTRHNQVNAYEFPRTQGLTSRTLRAVLRAIVEHLGNAAEAVIDRRQLAQVAEVSITQVRLAIKALGDQSLIAVTHRYDERGQAASAFRVCWANVVNDCPERAAVRAAVRAGTAHQSPYSDLNPRIRIRLSVFNRVREETLTNSAKSMEWLDWAISEDQRGQLEDSDEQRVFVLAAGSYALTKGKKAVALFVSIVGGRRHDWVPPMYWSKGQARFAKYRKELGKCRQAEMVASSSENSLNTLKRSPHTTSTRRCLY